MELMLIGIVLLGFILLLVIDGPHKVGPCPDCGGWIRAHPEIRLKGGGSRFPGVYCWWCREGHDYRMAKRRARIHMAREKTRVQPVEMTVDNEEE